MKKNLQRLTLDLGRLTLTGLTYVTFRAVGQLYQRSTVTLQSDVLVFSGSHSGDQHVTIYLKVVYPQSK
jgi:hypothetical protein